MTRQGTILEWSTLRRDDHVYSIHTADTTISCQQAYWKALCLECCPCPCCRKKHKNTMLVCSSEQGHTGVLVQSRGKHSASKAPHENNIRKTYTKRSTFAHTYSSAFRDVSYSISEFFTTVRQKPAWFDWKESQEYWLYTLHASWG